MLDIQGSKYLVKNNFFLLSLIYAFVFAISKIILLVHITMESQGLYGLVALAPYSSLAGLIASDILLGFIVAMVSWGSALTALILTDVILIIYIINAHYANLFGAYLGIRILNLGIDFADLRDSIAAEINVLLLIGLVFLILLHRVLTSRLKNIFKRNTFITSALATGIFIGFFGIRFMNLPTRFPQFRVNPIEALFISLWDKTTPSNTYSTFQTFVSESPFPESSAIASIEIRPPHKLLNVVLFLMESTGTVAAHRPNQETMPVAKALSKNGITWTSFYAPVPMTIKTYYSLQCGVYPGADMRPITTVRPRVPCKGIAEFFSERGYKTGLFHGGNFSFTHKLAFLLDRGWDVLFDAKTLPGRDQYEKKTWGIDDKAVFEAAKNWVAKNEDPFFVLIAPILPHHPYDTPEWWSPHFPTNKKIDRYHNSLAFEDELLGTFVEYLKKRGKFKDTLFVLVGDHGEAFNEHPFNSFHPIEIYEENIKVPFIISNPILFPNHIKSDQIGVLPDLLPTLLDVLDFKDNDYNGDGVSLLNSYPNRVVYFHTTFNESIHGLRDGRFKFIYRPKTGLAELYNLDRDPKEQNNIAEQFPQRIEMYIPMVKQWVQYTHGRLKN